jgi:hypothetical protein
MTASVRQQTSERGDKGTIGRPQLRPYMLASQHRKLVSQHQQFDVLGEFRLPTPNEQLQNSREREVGEREQHRPMLPGLTNARSRRPLSAAVLATPPGRF